MLVVGCLELAAVEFVDCDSEMNRHFDAMVLNSYCSSYLFVVCKWQVAEVEYKLIEFLQERRKNSLRVHNFHSSVDLTDHHIDLMDTFRGCIHSSAGLHSLEFDSAELVADFVDSSSNTVDLRIEMEQVMVQLDKLFELEREFVVQPELCFDTAETEKQSEMQRQGTSVVERLEQGSAQFDIAETSCLTFAAVAEEPSSARYRIFETRDIGLDTNSD